jgi:E3 ubiquitin-protein ligase HUWE1
MSVIRTTIKDLKSNVDVDEEFTSTLFSVVVQLVSQQAAGSMLVTAGLVPLLLELIQLDSKYSRTLAIAVELLDHIVLDVPSTFAAFSQARGVDILIEVIQKTVEYNLNPENRGNPPDYCVVDYALPYHRCQLIRALLGFVCNILTHTRSAERVHSLVDSALMKVAKDVILNASFLGCRVVSLAFQYLSNMLENDPSSFNIMNEAKVVHIAISNFDTLLGLSNSYFVPIAKFISALCHNEHGLSMVQDEHILRRYFSILSTHIINNDSFKNLGTTFDILTSDHTDLRPIIIEELLRLLKEVPNSLNALTHSRRFYFESEPVSPVAEQEIEMSSSHDIMATMTNVVHFLEGFLKNHLTRVEFIKQKGVSHLLRLFEVNNLPYEFAYSHTSHILSGTLRSLFDLDIDSDYIQEEILSKVRAGIQRVEDVVLDEFDMETGVQPEKRDAFVRELSRLNSILYAFYQIVFINPGTGYRIMFIMDKIAKNSSGDKDIILRLGRIVRYCIWQDALTVSGLPETVEEASRPLHVDLSTRSFKTLYDSDEFKKIKELGSKLKRFPVRFITK